MASESAIVVGVGPGLGLALVRRFGREGFRVATIARDAGKLEAFAGDLRREGIETATFAADVADEAALRQAVDGACAALGVPAVLIYNPSISPVGRPSELDPAALLDSLRVNVVGALVAVEAVLPGMRARGGGTILFTGGGTALQPASPAYMALGMGKASLRYLAYGLAEDLRAEGIHVATVTIRGTMREGTAFDPDRIAETFWTLYRQPRDSWQWEIQYAGGT